MQELGRLTNVKTVTTLLHVSVTTGWSVFYLKSKNHNVKGLICISVHAHFNPCAFQSMWIISYCDCRMQRPTVAACPIALQNYRLRRPGGCAPAPNVS